MTKTDRPRVRPVRPTFATVGDAVRYANKKRYKVIEHVSHARGARVNVVTRAGTPLALTVKEGEPTNARS